MKVYRIGEIATLVGVSTDTIRFYEKKGILEKPERTVSGYRLYSESVLKLLRFIIKAKRMGFTLNEIKELLEIKHTSDNTCEDVREKVKLKLKNIDNRIEELRKLKRVLTELVRTCDNRKGDTCPVLDIFEEEERRK